MDDAMVTARMSRGKKEAGNRVLKDLGMSASQAINDLYAYLIENRELPCAKERTKANAVSQADLATALSYIDSITHEGRFSTMTDDEIKRERMIGRGHMTAEDFS